MQIQSQIQASLISISAAAAKCANNIYTMVAKQLRAALFPQLIIC